MASKDLSATATRRQEALATILRARPQACHRSPSRAELGKALKIGNQAEVDRILTGLAKKGWLRSSR
ncbi:MAG: hypothetical protein OXK78_02625 [Caldilineaceae bacterium]|nr:hypothetical protein [Caldilineaceae bacterium]